MTWSSTVAHLCIVEGQERTPGMEFGKMTFTTMVLFGSVNCDLTSHTNDKTDTKEDYVDCH